MFSAKVIVSLSLIMIGTIDIQYRDKMGELIAGSLGDPEWGSMLARVQLWSGIVFIMAGLTLAAAILLGYDPGF